MKTYGLTKDYRIKLYLAVFSISAIIYALIDYYGISRMNIPDTFDLLVRMLLSLVSFSSINTIILFLINTIYKRKNGFNGTYKVAIKSSHKEKVIIGELQVLIGISTAKITLKTDQSFSESKTVYIDNVDKGKTLLTYTYLNDGNCKEKKKLYMHYGTCVLSFENRKFVCGRYYNDENRKTFGSIILEGNDSESSDKK